MAAIGCALAACGSFDGTDERDAGPSPDADAPEAAPRDAAPPDADADASRCSSSCPGAGRGPCAVRFDSGTASYCIDSTEVTEADYAVFVADKEGTPIDVGPPCGATTVRQPNVSRQRGNLPVTGVSFCDARAFCAWAGKRLCGHVDGGVLATSQYKPGTSQWYGACSGGTTTQVLRSGTCVLDASAPRAAGTTCEGAGQGLFDMVGNVWEWVDAPRVADGGAPYGSFAGGTYGSPSTFDCSALSAAIGKLDFRAQDVGFRCCSP